MVRKIIGSIIAVVGILVSGWGLWVFCMSIYYSAIKDRFMGDAAYLGFYYGLALIGIGIVPLLIGIFVYANPKALFGEATISKRQKIIALVTIILVVIFFGLKSETNRSFHKLSIYGIDVGIAFTDPLAGKIIKHTPSLMNEFDEATKNRQVGFKNIIGRVARIGYYRNQLIIATLVIGLISFIMAAKEN